MCQLGFTFFPGNMTFATNSVKVTRLGEGFVMNSREAANFVMVLGDSVSWVTTHEDYKLGQGYEV